MKKKILFLSAYNSSFVKNDREILRTFSDVTNLSIPRKRDILTITMLFYKIFVGVCKNDISYCWFVELPAYIAVFFSRILNKKCVVVVGGYEVADVPKIGYGGLLSKKNVKKVRYILRNADLTLAVSKSSKKEIENNFVTKQIKLIYNGVQIERFSPADHKKKNVITVGNVTNENLQRKGLETFVRSAAFLRNVKFFLIGKHHDDAIDHLRSLATENVVFTGFVSDDELLVYLQKAKVYVQVSAHEGFGISLAEAMLCECIPVVTSAGALPEVAGDFAFFVPFNDPPKTAEAIKKALEINNGKQFREQILSNYSLKKRAEQLKNIIGDIS